MDFSMLSSKTPRHSTCNGDPRVVALNMGPPEVWHVYIYRRSQPKGLQKHKSLQYVLDHAMKDMINC